MHVFEDDIEFQKGLGVVGDLEQVGGVFGNAGYIDLF